MASQVAFNSPAYSAMSASSSSSASVGSATLASLGTGSQEETERLLRHVTEDAGLRKEALDALIRAARRGSGRLSLRSPLGLFQPVSLALRDPDWEVRNKAINLLVEVTPRFGQQLSEGMAEVLPGLVACLADIKVANRRATTQCLHTYMKTMGSANTEPVLGAIIRYGLDAADPEIQRNVCVSVPVLLTPDLAGGNFSQLVAALAKCLTSKDEAMANAALHALEAIRSTLGDQLFNGYLQQLNPPLRRYYFQLDTLEAAVPHLEKFLAFLHSLLDDVNFRIAIVTLDILYLLANRLGSRLQPHLRSLLAGITKRMSDGKNVVRTALMKLAILLMHNHRPQIVLDLLLNNLEHRNSRVRQETLNMTISALVTFPSSDFDLPRLCNCIAPALLDPKRQVRHAALEVMALLAQGLGSGRLQPLQLAVREQETRPDATGLFEAVMSRLAKRQLPRLSAEGLVEYAIPVPSSATRRPQAGGAAAGSGGANEDWVMQASAGGYGSAKSRSELVDLETDSLASERRKSSAGRLAKGKLPWEPAASEPAPAPSQEVGRAKQKPPQQQQQATRSNDPASSTSVLNSRQQPQAQPPKAQPPQAESPAGHQGGPSAYVTNGRVKKFSEIPTDQQPRKVKRFLDQSEKPELQQGGDTASPGNQWNSGPTAKGSYLKNLEKQSKPRLVKSKRPELITSDVLDDLPSTSRSVASSQPQQAAPDQEGSAGKLPAIPKQQQQKRASDSVAASEAKNKRQGGPSYDSGNGDAAEAASPVPMKPQLARSAGKKPKRATAGPSNPPSDSGVGAAAANYSTASSTAPSSTRGSQIDAAEEHPPPEEINGSLHYIRHSASRKKALKVFENAESNHGAAGTYSSSPIQAASVLDSDNADSGLQRGGREFNIVGRGVFEVQPAAQRRLWQQAAVENVSSAPSAVATDSSALSGGVQGTAYRPNLIGNGGPDDEEDSAPSDRGRQQQQQQLQRTLSNTLRESVALRQRQRAAAERSASKAETEDERLIRELREGSANADTAQLSHRQQQEQTVSDSDSNLAKELR
uniref:TOG domain-containing protein n=1 Tax=Macrostomum lignano TaxID=282301 RepID=A0A1I8G3J6_9PLAT